MPKYRVELSMRSRATEVRIVEADDELEAGTKAEMGQGEWVEGHADEDAWEAEYVEEFNPDAEV